MSHALLVKVFIALAIGAAAVESASAQDGSSYKDRTITIYSAGTAGGGYDFYARLLARHLGRHLPGNPSVVVKNMPGAGGLVLANYLQSRALRDGTEFAALEHGTAFTPLLTHARVDFDPAKFGWLGSMEQFTPIAAVWHTMPIHSADDLLVTPMNVGGSGPGSTTSGYPNSLNAILGTKMKVISGYPGSAEINLAIERGEIHGRCALSWSSVKATLQHWLDDKKLRPLLQVASAKHADLPDVPLLMELAQDDETRHILRFLIARQVIGRPFFGPPEVPADRAAVLRKAFIDTLNDREFLAEADKAKLEINPVPAQRIEDLLRELYAIPADITKKAAVLFN